jgi:hypothetical protein
VISPDEAAQQVIAAIQARDNVAYATAFETLVEAVQMARPQDIESALDLPPRTPSPGKATGAPPRTRR